MRLIKKICVFLSVVALALISAGYQSSAAAKRLFGNMTYLTDSPYLLEKVTLKNGSYEGRYGRLFYGLYFEGKYVYGDWNYDGRQDAAVIVSQSQNGSAENLTLAFLINDGTKLVHRQSASLGDRTMIHALRERDGKVFLDMLIHQSGDCMAGPTKRVRYCYEYTGQGQWVQGSVVKIFPPRKLHVS